MPACYQPQNRRQLNVLRIKSHTFWLLLLIIVGAYQMGTGLWIVAKANLAQYFIAQAWQATLVDKKRHRPWPWADTYPVVELSIKKDTWYVLADANGRNLAFGPTHLTSTPIPGEIGNSVIVGHRDTQFNSLKTLKVGDIIEVKNIKGTSHYQVSDLRIARLRQLSLWQWDNTDEANQSTLTLVTCYPFDSLKPNPIQRFIVTAVKI
jgi:sortase A